jgi:hypothetical protein
MSVTLRACKARVRVAAAALWPSGSANVANIIYFAVIFAGLVCLSNSASAQYVQQGPKLTGSDAVPGIGGNGSKQGASVALSADGNTAIVGGPDDETGHLASSIGAAWVYTRSGGVWTQQGPKLVGTGAVGTNGGGAAQGTSVALSADGNTAIVGGPDDNSGAGAIWVFTRSGGVWTQQGSKLVGTGAAGNAEQGQSVALSADGNTAIVGGPNDNYNPPSALAVGAIWVFTRSGGVWTQQGSKLVGTGSAGNAEQGQSVALSADGNTAIVGGPDDAFSQVTPPSGTGAAWVFTRSGGVWTQQGSKLVGTGALGRAAQGQSVALSADSSTAIIGGPQDNSGVGAAWVFTPSGGVWTQQGPKLVGGANGGFSEQGGAVGLSGDGNTAIVGGPNNAGAIWVFTRSGGVWPQLGAELVGTGAVGPDGAEQGASVAITADASTLIEGGPEDAIGVGAAWVFVVPHNLTATHDFNGDGISDILWRNSAGAVGMWLMNGAQILQTATLTNAAPTNWSIVGQRDFTGNGDADILWRDTTGDVGMWLMNGTHVLSGSAFSTMPTNWFVAGTGDFNGDGIGDILWRDAAGDVAIWLMNGTTVEQTLTIGNVSPNWVIVGATMNGDIFWRNTVTGEVGMWVMGNGQIAQTVDFGAVSLNWTVAGIGDFDGNGSFDILWRDTSGNVGIWLMNGTQIMSTSVLGNVSANWSIAQTGDYNGNGDSDILWIDNAGNLAAWFMNGAAISSVVNYGNVGTAWSVQSLNAE